MGTAIGLYFPGTQDEINALRDRLNYLFGNLGYAEENSTPAYRGGLPAGLLALDSGELALVLLADEQRASVREWLYRQADALEPQAKSFQEVGLIEALRVIADALTAAMHRKVEAELEEADEE